MTLLFVGLIVAVVAIVVIAFVVRLVRGSPQAGRHGGRHVHHARPVGRSRPPRVPPPRRAGAEHARADLRGHAVAGGGQHPPAPSIDLGQEQRRLDVHREPHRPDLQGPARRPRRASPSRMRTSMRRSSTRRHAPEARSISAHRRRSPRRSTRRPRRRRPRPPSAPSRTRRRRSMPAPPSRRWRSSTPPTPPRTRAATYGFVTADSTLDPAFVGTLFTLEQGETTPVIEGDDGVWRIGRVETIRARHHGHAAWSSRCATTSAGTCTARRCARRPSPGSWRTRVVTDATDADLPQAHLAEILLERIPPPPPARTRARSAPRTSCTPPRTTRPARRRWTRPIPAWAEAEAPADAGRGAAAKVTDPELQGAGVRGARQARQRRHRQRCQRRRPGVLHTGPRWCPSSRTPCSTTTALAARRHRGPRQERLRLARDRVPGAHARAPRSASTRCVAKLAVDGADFAALRSGSSADPRNDRPRLSSSRAICAVKFR